MNLFNKRRGRLILERFRIILHYDSTIQLTTSQYQVWDLLYITLL